MSDSPYAGRRDPQHRSAPSPGSAESGWWAPDATVTLAAIGAMALLAAAAYLMSRNGLPGPGVMALAAIAALAVAAGAAARVTGHRDREPR